MKVSQTVEMKCDRFYVGYGYCEFMEGDNQARVSMTDDQLLELYDDLAPKRERIMKQRAEEAAQLLSQTEEGEDE